MRRLSFLLLLLISHEASAVVRFVNAAATGSNNGTSWTNAYTSLQSALGVAASGDTIWVANGVYRPTVTVFNPPRDSAFVVPSGVALFGGFVGTETDLSQRNFTAFQTILDGDIGGASLAFDNSYNVVRLIGSSTATRLDGFRISGGNSTGAVPGIPQGGGIHADASNATIANCFITQHEAYNGGAIHISGAGNVEILDCILSNNIGGSGGALLVTGTNATMRRCTIIQNTGIQGGGVHAYGGATLTMDQCNVSGNQCALSGTIVGSGAGIYIASDAALNISNSLVVGNVATDYGGFYAQLALGPLAPIAITNCTFAHNLSTANPSQNAAIRLRANTTMKNSIVWGNVSAQGFQIDYSPGIIADRCIVQDIFSGFGLTNIYNIDPQFVAPGAAASAPFTTASHDYHLLPTSHGIDTGSNAAIPTAFPFDLDNAARLFGPLVDLGAYERTYCPLTASIALSSASSTICAGSNAALTASGGTSYAWNTGATSQAITVTTAGTYKVVVSNAAGCRGSAVQSISVSAPQPVVQIMGATLTTGAFASYQWSLNGVIIPGATAQSYTPTTSGSYRVAATDAAGCTATSGAVQFSVSGVEDAVANGFSFYPNPATGTLFLTVPGAVNVLVEILSTDGRMLRQASGAATAGKPLAISLEGLPAGIYTVRAASERGVYSKLVRVAR